MRLYEKRFTETMVQLDTIRGNARPQQGFDSY